MRGRSIDQKATSKSGCSCEVEGQSHLPISWTMVILVLGACGRLLAVREFITAYPRNTFYYRPYEMGLVASSLLHGLGFSSPFGGATGPTAIVAPGYPIAVAGIFYVFGTYTAASAVVIMLLQVLVSLLTIWLMMHVATKTLGAQSALIAGAFWAVSIPLLWVPTIFWETSLSQCALVGMTALALRCRQNPSRGMWALLGTCCALASLTNPALLVSLVAMMAWAAYQTRRSGCRGPLLGLLALLVVFAPWPIRNAIRFHAFIPLRSTVGIELYMGNHPGATGRIDESHFPMFNKQEMASYISKGEVAYTHDKSAEAWAYIAARPATFVKVSMRRFYRFWSGTGNANGPGIYAMHALTTTLLGGVGLLFLFRRGKRSLALLMALPLILFPLPYYITHAEFRYRLNVDPLLTILAAYAVTQIVALFRRQRGLEENLI
ncbi:MAG TPA: glycosyltransferase family 39 protein [Acidobacteriaceae bacterium]|nr:glycosyltransferase family 39 protein [Acidobacteriaceae bacterium]